MIAARAPWEASAPAFAGECSPRAQPRVRARHSDVPCGHRARAAATAPCRLFLLFLLIFARASEAVAGQQGERGAAAATVSDLDGLYQALLAGSTEIVVDFNIGADDALSRKAAPQAAQLLTSFSIMGGGSTEPSASVRGSRSRGGGDAPVGLAAAVEEGSYFPPVENHSTRLVCGIPDGSRCLLAGTGRGTRAFLVRAGGNLYLEGFELTGWSATTGGAIRVDGGGTATLVDCVLEGNSASAGGVTHNGTAPDSSSAFVGSSWGLTSAGGAVLVAGGAFVDARGVEFVSNTAEGPGAGGAPDGFGGAVAVLGPGSLLRCAGCSFLKNFAGAAGGAVAAAAGGGIALSGPTGRLSGNSAKLAGGAMAIVGFGSRAEAADLIFSGNSAELGPGGALALDRLGPSEGTPPGVAARPLLLARRCAIADNRAGSNGGALSLSGFSSAFLEQCSVSGASSPRGGGGLFLSAGSQANVIASNVSDCSSGKMGGAVMLTGEDTVLELTLALFNDNRAQSYGGHISAIGDSRVLATDSAFVSGTSENLGGGAIYINGQYTRLAARGVFMHGNSAKRGCGGAINVADKALATVIDSTLKENSALHAGAICASLKSHVLLTGNTVLDSNNATASLDGISIVVKSRSGIIMDDATIVTPSNAPPSAIPLLLLDDSNAVLSGTAFLRGLSELPPGMLVDVKVDDNPDMRARVFFASQEPGLPLVNVLYADFADRPAEACPPLSCTLPPSAQPARERLSGQCPSLPAMPIAAPGGSELGSSPLLAEEFTCRPDAQRALVAELPFVDDVLPFSCIGESPAALVPPGKFCGPAGSASAFVTLPCSDGRGESCPLPAAEPPSPLPPPPSPLPPPPPPEPLTGTISQENAASPPPPGTSASPTPAATETGAIISDPNPSGPATDMMIIPRNSPPRPSEGSEPSATIIIGLVAALTGSLLIFSGGAIFVFRRQQQQQKRAHHGHVLPRTGPNRPPGLSLAFGSSSGAPLYHTVDNVSPYSSNATVANSRSETGAAPTLAPITPGWRSVYQFLPCGKVDMLVDECADGSSPGKARLEEVDGKPGVFAPKRPEGRLVRGPALPHLAPKGWARSEVYMTLPARLLDLQAGAGTSPPSSPSSSELDALSSPGSGKGPVMERRKSLPLALDVFPDNAAASTDAVEATDGPGLAPAPAHRSVSHLARLDGGEVSTQAKPTAEGCQPQRHNRRVPNMHGLSISDWNNSGLEEIDFEAEIKPNLGQRIGSGAFGDVFLAEWRGKQVAVKIFNRGYCGATGEQAESFRQEVMMMTRLGRGCRQIVSIYGANFKQPNMALVYQYIPGGDLYSRIHDAKKPPLTYLEILKIGRDLANGLSFLHPSVVHRDLKPMNILLDDDGTAMLIDFGVSRERSPEHSYFNTKAGGTPAYMAPEMFNGDKFSEKVDVYALGCILYECVSREAPWKDIHSNFGIIVYTVSVLDERPAIPGSCPARLRRLIERCWDKDPRSRPSCYEIAQKLGALIQQEQQRLERGQDEELGVGVHGVPQAASATPSPLDAAPPPTDTPATSTAQVCIQQIHQQAQPAAAPPQQQQQQPNASTAASATQVWRQLMQGASAGQPAEDNEASSSPAGSSAVNV